MCLLGSLKHVHGTVQAGRYVKLLFLEVSQDGRTSERDIRPANSERYPRQATPKWQSNGWAVWRTPVRPRSQLSRFPCSRPVWEPPSVQLHSPCPSEAERNGDRLGRTIAEVHMPWQDAYLTYVQPDDRSQVLSQAFRSYGRRLPIWETYTGEVWRFWMAVQGSQGPKIGQNAGAGCPFGIHSIFNFSHYVYYLAMGNFTALWLINCPGAIVTRSAFRIRGTWNRRRRVDTRNERRWDGLTRV